MNEQAEVDRWDVELEDAPPKSGVPKWVWGCGGGCLLLLVVTLVGTIWFFNKILAEYGPEKTWPVVQEIMPFTDEGATDEEIIAAAPMGYTCGTIPVNFLEALDDASEEAGEEEDGDTAAGDEESSAEEFRLDRVIVLNPGLDSSKPRGTGVSALLFVFDARLAGSAIDYITPAFEDAEVSDESRGRARETLQGREVDTYHFRVEGAQGGIARFMPGGSDAQGMLAIDVTGDRERSIVVLLMATGDVDATIEGADGLLLPFDVWAGR